MKRYVLFFATFLTLAFNAKALDYETAREQAYYLTDKMAYELNLSDAQYNDAYEINLDYFLALNSPRDIELAYLRHRNEDLRYILMDWQWRSFMAEEYFFNPVRWVSGAWYFPIYRHYHRTYYFYDRPRIFWNYRGAHGRVYYTHRSYYADRRHHWNGGLRGNHKGLIGRPVNGRDGRFDNNGRFGRGNNYNNRNTRNDRRDFNNRNDRNTRSNYNNTNTRSGRNGFTDRSSTTTRRYNNTDMRSSSRTTVNSMRNTESTRSTGVGTRSTTRSENMGTSRSIGSGRSTGSTRSMGSGRENNQGGNSRSSGRR